MEKERNNWVRCPECGHKLFKNVNYGRIDEIEIKCHSCKKIITITRNEIKGSN